MVGAYNKNKMRDGTSSAKSDLDNGIFSTIDLID
jgi:hypothetical protein